MPASKGRDSASATPPPERKAQQVAVGSPPWYAPMMVTLMILGLLWVVTFYITRQEYPIPQLGRWNLGIGFALMLSGFFMTTRWR